MTKKKNLASEDKKTTRTASLAVSSSCNAAAILELFGSPFGEQDILALIRIVKHKTNSVKEGNIKDCEAMLYGQALALQSMFMMLVRKGEAQNLLKHYETYMRLALKAQNQCRSSLEALAALKNPPVVYAAQANIEPPQFFRRQEIRSCLRNYHGKETFIPEVYTRGQGASSSSCS